MVKTLTHHGSQFYSIEDTPLIKQFLIVEGMERVKVFTIGWPMIYLKMSIPNSTDMLFSSPQIFSGVHVTFMCMVCRSLFVLFLLVIVLSVLRFTDSDCSFDIFKLFLLIKNSNILKDFIIFEVASIKRGY
jgi:hypothetical protein